MYVDNSFDRLDHSNFLDFAMRAYNNPDCTSIDEFEDDIRILRYLKKAFNKYRDRQAIKVELVLNHLRVLYNVFQPEMACTKILVLRLNEHLDVLKPFLVHMNTWPDEIPNLGLYGEVIYGSDIPMDSGIIAALREYKAAK